MKVYNQSTNAVVCSYWGTNQVTILSGSDLEFPRGVWASIGGVGNMDTWLTEAVLLHDDGGTVSISGEGGGQWYGIGFSSGFGLVLVCLAVLAIKRGLRVGGEDI